MATPKLGDDSFILKLYIVLLENIVQLILYLIHQDEI